jgi:ParB family chromosome partitioning protein
MRRKQQSDERMVTKLKGLGRGLDALLGESQARAPLTDTSATLKVDQLQSGKYQPRTRMDETSLAELSESIKAQGIIQPILVRPVDGARYEIIAGERRWRAARLAGLQDVPVIVRDVPDTAALAMALIENIQREDLNPLEEAAGIQRLLSEFDLTHEQAAQAVGRSRTATTNLLRLLTLSKPVQQLVFEGALDMGHGRALLALEGPRQQEVARKVAEGGLSVRETERLVHALLHPPVKTKKPAPRNARDVERFEEELSERFGTTVEIKTGKKGSGKLVITYSNAEHLDDLLAKFKG